jgi:hypothetical protein
MPRVTSVEKARKSPGTCGKCSKVIKAGSSYIHWKFRYGGKRIRCSLCPRPRQSELTNSDKLSRCYAAGESIEDAIACFRKDFDIEDLRGALENAASECTEVADEYRDSASNVESGMNGNRMPICDELEEKADNLESKASDIESAAGQLEEFDEDQAKEEAETEAGEAIAEEGGDKAEKDDNAFDAKVQEILKEKKDDWAEEQISLVEEFTDISPES